MSNHAERREQYSHTSEAIIALRGRHWQRGSGAKFAPLVRPRPVVQRHFGAPASVFAVIGLQCSSISSQRHRCSTYAPVSPDLACRRFSAIRIPLGCGGNKASLRRQAGARGHHCSRSRGPSAENRKGTERSVSEKSCRSLAQVPLGYSASTPKERKSGKCWSAMRGRDEKGGLSWIRLTLNMTVANGRAGGRKSAAHRGRSRASSHSQRHKG